ncbi:MAG: SDR family oxidoreductase, partial [Pseudomonadales bacterium]
MHVLITAGATGIGRTIADEFLSKGWQVHVCDVAEQAVAEWTAGGPGRHGYVADAADARHVDDVFDRLAAVTPTLDALVNNVGIAGPTAPVESIEPADWDRTVAVDLSAHFYSARRAIPMLKRNGGGSIVSIASNAALFGLPLRAPYVASKWALIGLTKTLAMELGPFNIRANAICPGSVRGPRIDGVIEREARWRGLSPDVVRHAYERQSSMRCFVDAADVAQLAAFLCDPRGARISGQAIAVDGHTETLGDLTEFL